MLQYTLSNLSRSGFFLGGSNSFDLNRNMVPFLFCSRNNFFVVDVFEFLNNTKKLLFLSKKLFLKHTRILFLLESDVFSNKIEAKVDSFFSSINRKTFSVKKKKVRSNSINSLLEKKNYNLDLLRGLDLDFFSKLNSFNDRLLELSDLFSFFSNKYVLNREKIMLAERIEKKNRMKKLNMLSELLSLNNNVHTSFISNFSFIPSFYINYFFKSYYSKLYLLSSNFYLIKRFTPFDSLVFLSRKKISIQFELSKILFSSSIILSYFSNLHLRVAFQNKKILDSVYNKSILLSKNKNSTLKYKLNKISNVFFDKNSAKIYLFKLMFRVFKFRKFLVKKHHVFKRWIFLLSKIKLKSIRVKNRYKRFLDLYSYILRMLSDSQYFIDLFLSLKELAAVKNQLSISVNQKSSIFLKFSGNHFKANNVFWTRSWLSGALTNFYGLKFTLKKSVLDFDKMRTLPEFVMLFNKRSPDNFITEVFNLDIPFLGLSSLNMNPYFFHYYVPANTSDKDLLYFYFILVLESFLRAHLEEVNRVVL